MALVGRVNPIDSLKARIKPIFPARVVGGDGITIVKAGGVYTFSWDVTELTEIGALSVSDHDNILIPFWNKDTLTFRTVAIDTLLTSLSGALDPTLVSIAALTPTTDQGIYFTAADTAAVFALTTFGRSLVDDADGATALTTLGISAFAQTLLDDANAGAALTTLGISAFAQTILDDANAAAVLVTIGAQPLDADLTAIAAFSGTGLAVRTASNTWAQRSLAAPAAGFTITNPAGVAGDPTFVLANDLAALEGLSSDGFAARITTDGWAQRTFTAPAAGFTITNPAGVAGNPTFVLADDLAALEGLSSTGLAARTGTSTWAERTLTAPAAGFTITNPAGIAGNPTFVLANDLAALEALSGTNTIYYRSASDTWTAVTIGSALSFSAGSLNVAVDGVTNAGLANMAEATIKGRQAAVGTGDPTDLTATQVKTILGYPTSTTDNAAIRANSTSGDLQESVLIIADTTGDLSRSGNGGIDIQGTNTNDSAAAGQIGEFVFATCGNGGAAVTVTMTIASPCVVTWTAHGITGPAAVKFTTTGALPTGVTAGTTYYGVQIDANSMNIATSIANAVAGTFINTSGSQSGTHTGMANTAITSGSPFNVAGISLTAGDWDLYGFGYIIPNTSTTLTAVIASISQTSATLDVTSLGASFISRFATYTGADLAVGGFTTGPTRKSFSVTTTVYMIVQASFATSTATGYGGIRARRIR